MNDTSHQALGRKARAALNPIGIAVSLAWFDRTVGRYYVYGYFPCKQSEVDAAPWPDNRAKCGMGTGTDPQGAIEALENKFFGGL